jgi:hypothetical protein
MAKTLKQIADEIGISKQRVYRFVKQEGITGTHQENQTIYYDEQAEQTVTSSPACRGGGFLLADRFGSRSIVPAY